MRAYNHIPPTRNIPVTIRRSVRKYAVEIGEATWAWNRLHSALQTLFATVLDADVGRLGISIWQSRKSDDGQRAMLKAAAEVRLKGRLRTRVLWVLKETGRIAAYRNDAIHTPIMHVGSKSKVVPEPVTASPDRFQRLTAVGHSRLYRALRGDAFALSYYALAIRAAILFPAAFGTLPKRPRLQAYQLAQKHLPKTNTQKRKPRRRKRLPKP